MPAQTKPLTPSELSALEHAFAADPASDAYRPLTEAYLAMGRFMEAMVVCKKGVKAHAGDVAARLLLARVYAEQGKDRKALDEVLGALQEHPSDPVANRTAGVLHMKLGEKEPVAFEPGPDPAFEPVGKIGRCCLPLIQPPEKPLGTEPVPEAGYLILCPGHSAEEGGIRTAEERAILFGQTAASIERAAAAAKGS